MRIGVRAGIGGGGSDAETLRSHRPPPPTAASHPLGAERGWGRSDRCPPQPGGRPQISRIVPALSPQPQSGWQPATGMEPRLGDGGDLEGDGGGGSGRGGGQQVRPYLIPGRGGGGAQEGEQPAQPHPAASRPRVAAAAPPPRPPRPRSSSGAAAVRGQQPGRERRAPPPLPQSPAGWVGGFHPRPVPRSHGFCGVRRTPGTTAAQRSISALRHPSRTERRRLFPPSHPPGPAAGTANPPPLPSWRCGLSHRSDAGAPKGPPAPWAAAGGSVSAPRWGGAEPSRHHRSWSGSISARPSSVRTEPRVWLPTRPRNQREALSPRAAATAASQPRPCGAGRGFAAAHRLQDGATAGTNQNTHGNSRHNGQLKAFGIPGLGQ